MQVGMQLNRSVLCEYSPKQSRLGADVIPSRTYGEDTGEDIREGYEPTEDAAALDGADEFAIGEDDGTPGEEESEESRQWKKTVELAVQLKPKYGLEGEAFENVWDGGEPSESPKENP